MSRFLLYLLIPDEVGSSNLREIEKLIGDRLKPYFIWEENKKQYVDWQEIEEFCKKKVIPIDDLRLIANKYSNDYRRQHFFDARGIYFWSINENGKWDYWHYSGGPYFSEKSFPDSDCEIGFVKDLISIECFAFMDTEGRWFDRYDLPEEKFENFWNEIHNEQMNSLVVAITCHC